ncbi:MAG: hypothetical protein WAL63_02295, partial [Solirubrobacteraceae bacterium]
MSCNGRSYLAVQLPLAMSATYSPSQPTAISTARVRASAKTTGGRPIRPTPTEMTVAATSTARAARWG